MSHYEKVPPSSALLFNLFLTGDFVALSDLDFSLGADNLINIIEDMTGQRPSVFFRLCWKYVSPLVYLVSQALSQQISTQFTHDPTLAVQKPKH